MISVEFFDDAFAKLFPVSEKKELEVLGGRDDHRKPYVHHWEGPGEKPFDPKKVCRSMWLYECDRERYISEGINTFRTLPLHIGQIPHRIPYVEGLLFDNIPKRLRDHDKHIGQRKMFLAELQFLTHALKKHTDYAYCIYFGSAPHMKGGLLNSLFPNIIWILVDANEHFIWHKGNRGYSHYQAVDTDLYRYMAVGAATPKWTGEEPTPNNIKYHTDKPKTIKHYKSPKPFDKRNQQTPIPYEDDAVDYILGNTATRFFIFEQYADRKLTKMLNRLVTKSPHPVLIMSDVRLENNSLGVLADQALYYTWVKDLIANNTTPVMSCFKMRFPFLGTEPITDISPYQQIFDDAAALGGNFTDSTTIMPFFGGKYMIQAWPVHNSTEGRLWSTRAELETLTNWDMIDVEERFAYYNRLMRHVGMFPNPDANRLTGFDHCGDCALESHILGTYCDKFPESRKRRMTIHLLISEIGLSTMRGIKGEAHGKCFPDEPFDYK